MQEKRPIGNAHDLHARQGADALDDSLLVVQVAGAESDVAGDVSLVHLNDIHRADLPLGLADRRGDAAELPRRIAIS